MIQPRSCSILSSYPLPDTQALERALREEVEKNRRKIVVLDDDPTGVQTVHDIYVYTDWTLDSLRRAFAAPERLFYILTNSRSFTEEETAKAHTEIARRVDQVAKETGMEYLMISRSDSTLRGHYPLETQLLRQVAEEENSWKMDGEILCPYFKEGGRFTLNNIHYVRYGGTLVPCAQTEFAKDKVFGYTSSDLREYIQEKTGGAFPAREVKSISLDSLRTLDYDRILEQLMQVSGFGKVVVNAVDDCDVEAFAVALYRALERGKHFTIRCAAALVKAVGGISSQPLLRREQMVAPGTSRGGIIVVGSHTQKTTAQLEELKQLRGIDFLELDSDKVLVPGALEEEVARVVRRCGEQIARGVTCCVSTRRALLTCPGDTDETILARGMAISDAVQRCVGQLPVAPAFVVAKGGITSSDVGTKALKVRRAKVLGQIRPGVPVWQTGPESAFPGVPYVIFPGNVGEVSTLREAVEILLG